MEHLFSIGELSKYQKISKQTLIFYDKIGLFRPAYADPNNGYRYYSASQIDYLDTILLMKKIGFSLNEIKDHMQHYNIDSSLVALRNQLTVIDRQIQELRLIMIIGTIFFSFVTLPHSQRKLLIRVFAQKPLTFPHTGSASPGPGGGGTLHAPGDQHRNKEMLCRLFSAAAARIFSMRCDRSFSKDQGGTFYRSFSRLSSHRRNRQNLRNPAIARWKMCMYLSHRRLPVHRTFLPEASGLL